MRHQKIQVMHVRDSSGIYGGERVILTLGNKLNRDVFDFKLLCMQRTDIRSQILANYATEMEIDTISLPTKGKFDWWAIKKLRALFDNNDVDIVHSHDFKADFYVMVASHGMNMKKIATAHGSTRDSFVKRLYLEFNENFVYRQLDRVVAVSDSVAGDLNNKGLNPNKICVIQNGLDLNIIKNKHDKNKTQDNLNIEINKKTFAIVGRLFPDKGHPFFLKAVAKIIHHYPEIQILIIGDGPSRETIVNQIKALGLENYVNMCGVIKNMQYVYERIDCLVIASLREGLPYVLLEAAANHVPVIATAVGDIPQLIKDRKTGYLVEPANTAELEDRMVRFLKKKDNITQMVENCYNVFERKFSADRMVRETEDLYLSLFDLNQRKSTCG